MGNFDRVYEAFIEGQTCAAQTLNQASDIVCITTKKLNWGHLYRVKFLCKGLVNDGREIREHNQFELGVHFPEHYLRRCKPAEIVCWFGPANIWHPNIKPPFLCLGRVAPGTQIIDIVNRAYEIISYQKVTMVESNALNREACAWARANSDRFPIDKRPLRRRTIEVTMEEIRKEVSE